MRGFATSQSLLRQRVIQVAIAGAMTMMGVSPSQSLLRQRVIQVAIAGAITMMGVSPSQSLLRQRVIQVAKKMVVSPAMATNLNRFFVSESFRSHHHRYGHWERRGISIA